MPTKRHPKNTSRQKRLIHTQKRLIHTVGTQAEAHLPDRNSPEGKEAAIVRKFHQIQRSYTRLMADVAKELDLVKGWIGTQAMIKRKDLKARLSSRLSRN